MSTDYPQRKPVRIVFELALNQACSRRGPRERNLRSKIRWFTEFCNSHYVSQLAAFFIDARTKRSTVKSCLLVFLVCISHTIIWFNITLSLTLMCELQRAFVCCFCFDLLSSVVRQKIKPKRVSSPRNTPQKRTANQNYKTHTVVHTLGLLFCFFW